MLINNVKSGSLNQQFDDTTVNFATERLVLEHANKLVNDWLIELNQRTVRQNQQKIMERLGIFLSSIDSFEGGLITGKIAQIIVVVEHFQDRVQWLPFKCQSLADHSINSFAAYDRIVSQIVVVALEQERQLACFLR